jgi:hypothetical protein
MRMAVVRATLASSSSLRWTPKVFADLDGDGAAGVADADQAGWNSRQVHRGRTVTCDS